MLRAFLGLVFMLGMNFIIGTGKVEALRHRHAVETSRLSVKGSFESRNINRWC